MLAKTQSCMQFKLYQLELKEGKRITPVTVEDVATNRRRWGLNSSIRNWKKNDNKMQVANPKLPYRVPPKIFLVGVGSISQEEEEKKDV